MKKTYALILPLMLLCIGALQGQIYVDASATGANDGSSWENAYADLSDAIDASLEGDQIWVAAGTYKPRIVADDTLNAFFSFPHDLQLYGGFAGTESSLAERDWEANVTTLSGDHLGNDINNNFFTNREDNSYHVMWLTDTITNATIIDGLTIRNGNTAPSSGSGNDRRSGGILTYGAPIIKHCTFTQHYGYFGGSLYPRGADADGVVVDSCTFVDNWAGFGAAIYIISPTGTITNTTFDNNTTETSHGGAVYNGTPGGTTFDNCIFTNNEVMDGRGGAVYNNESPSTYTNCVFEGNSVASSSGGALMVRNADDANPFITVSITDCSFTSNSSGFGGAIGSYDKKSIMEVTNCTFDNNTAGTSGGASTNGFGSTSIFTDCTFTSNTAEFGGAVFSQNDSSYVVVRNCMIGNNSATTTGGAINLGGDDDPLSTQPLPLLEVENTIFSGNSAIGQAGAINIGNANLSVSSSLFDFNFVTEPDGYGGAMSLNSSDSFDLVYNVINTTFVNNIALGCGIGNWVESDTAASTLTLQNNIFYNPDGDDYAVEDGEPTVVSNGGNLSQDASMVLLLTGTNDLTETDPGFVDFGSFDYHLLDDSPAVDMGIADGAPEFDLDGNPRVNEVDMGAYENQTMVGTRDLNAFGHMRLFPVPVVEDELTFNIRNPYQGRVQVTITANNGAVIMNQTYVKSSEDWTENLDVSQLPHGLYLLTISNGSESSVRKFVK